MTEATDQNTEKIIVKRYPNRKLYDTTNSRYVNLEQLADLVREGVDIQVVEHKSGEDLTATTLSQIAFNEERKRNRAIPTDLVKRLLQTSGAGVQDLVDKISPMLTRADTQVDTLRDEIEEHVRRWIEKGTLTVEEGNHLVRELWEQSIKNVDAFQSTIDTRVTTAVERIIGGAVIREKVDDFMHRVDILEKRMDVLEDKLRRVGDRIVALLEDNRE